MPHRKKKHHAVVGVFETKARTDRAVADLKAAGFEDDDIGMVYRDTEGKMVKTGAADDTYAEEGAAIGAAAGALAGAGVGAAVVAGAIPVIGPVLAIGLDQRAGDAELEGAGLARLTAAVHVRLHVERAEGVGGLERTLDVEHERRPREVIPEGPAVHVPLAGAGGQVHPRHGGLAAAGGLPAILGLPAHAVTFAPVGAMT